MVVGHLFGNIQVYGLELFGHAEVYEWYYVTLLQQYLMGLSSVENVNVNSHSLCNNSVLC